MSILFALCKERLLTHPSLSRPATACALRHSDKGPKWHGKQLQSYVMEKRLLRRLLHADYAYCISNSRLFWTVNARKTSLLKDRIHVISTSRVSFLHLIGLLEKTRPKMFCGRVVREQPFMCGKNNGAQCRAYKSAGLSSTISLLLIYHNNLHDAWFRSVPWIIVCKIHDFKTR